MKLSQKHASVYQTTISQMQSPSLTVISKHQNSMKQFALNDKDIKTNTELANTIISG